MASSSAAAAVSKSAHFSTIASDWTQFEEFSNLYPNPNPNPNQAWGGSSGNYDLVESLMKSNQGRISGSFYGGYGSEEAELMRRISVVDPTRSVQRTMSSSLVEGSFRGASTCLLRSSSFPQHEQQLCSSSSNSSSRAAETKALPFKNNGVELSDEDQQSSIQQQMTMNNGKNVMQQPKNNINTRKRARADQNSNPKAMETPPDVVHVRARRGQATDSHSLAERVRREKISQRMKVLQEIVPGCHKVLGKAMMLDEIINYVKSLQKQVEFLSMKLATANQVGIDSMIMNKDCAFVNEFLQNMVSFPSHGDVAYVNMPNELSSTCQQLRPEVLMTSLIQ